MWLKTDEGTLQNLANLDEISVNKTDVIGWKYGIKDSFDAEGDCQVILFTCSTAEEAEGIVERIGEKLGAVDAYEEMSVDG